MQDVFERIDQLFTRGNKPRWRWQKENTVGLVLVGEMAKANLVELTEAPVVIDLECGRHWIERLAAFTRTEGPAEAWRFWDAVAPSLLRIANEDPDISQVWNEASAYHLRGNHEVAQSMIYLR